MVVTHDRSIDQLVVSKLEEGARERERERERGREGGRERGPVNGN